MIKNFKMTISFPSRLVRIGDVWETPSDTDIQVILISVSTKKKTGFCDAKAGFEHAL